MSALATSVGVFAVHAGSYVSVLSKGERMRLAWAAGVGGEGVGVVLARSLETTAQSTRSLHLLYILPYS